MCFFIFISTLSTTFITWLLSYAFSHRFNLCCSASTGITEDLLVIETSGLCDPAPVLSTLEQLEDLALWPRKAAAQISRQALLPAMSSI